VQKVAALFPRIDATSLSPAGAEGKGKGVSSVSDKIPLGDFQKVDLRVAEVVAAEKVEKSKRLLKLTVKVDEETRTLVAGVAEHYDPAALVGKKVVIVANLEPATLMGVESNGMVLAATHGETVSLLTLDKDVPSGSKVK
jgi:methionyl-tRNA synthetase